jgi:hypothetical protein
LRVKHREQSVQEQTCQKVLVSYRYHLCRVEGAGGECLCS